MTRTLLRPFLFICILALSTLSVSAQSRVYDKDILGEWKLVFDLGEQGDNAFERIVLRAIDGFLDEIDVRFEFQKDHKVRITVNAMGGDEENEEAEWQINSDGQLIIDDNDHVDSGDVWMMKDGKLYAYNLKDGEIVDTDEGIHLEKLK